MMMIMQKMKNPNDQKNTETAKINNIKMREAERGGY